MPQPPRLVPPNNAGGRAGLRGAAPASVPVPPSTPRKNAEGFDELLRSLKNDYQLEELKIGAGLKSPARSKTVADGVIQRLRYFYYQDESTLDEVLSTFAISAKLLDIEKRLGVLAEILRRKDPRGVPVSRSGTPVSARNVPQTRLKTPQPSVEDTPRSRGLFDNYRKDAAYSRRADDMDPGSPTDEDEDDFVTPPLPRESSRSLSPSVTSMSAKRRVEASAHLSLKSTTRKRPSDCSTETARSQKLTKTSEGAQPFHKSQVPAAIKPAPSLFKRPSLDMARSFYAPVPSQSTVNTSFNTVSSSQQTQPDTANTSFTSDAGGTEIHHPFMKRTSSTTIGSLDDQDFLTVNAKLHREAAKLESRVEPSSVSSQGRDSSSNWGSSLPEEDLLDASARVESLHTVSSVRPRRLSQQQPAPQIGGSQPVLSPVKNGAFNNSKAAAMSLHQSFPPPQGASAMSPNKSALSPIKLTNGVTTTRHQSRSIREQTPVESPSKIGHRIRDIVEQGLFVSEPSVDLRAMPYFALFICQRIALEHKISVAELVRNMDVAQACADPEVFWQSLRTHDKVTHIKFKDPDRLWSAAKRSFDGFTFKGQINLRSKRSGPIFELDLHPILPDKSCRFQRKFGADRFLYLNVPELDVKGWGGGTQEDLKSIRERWSRWLDSEHTFLYRKWRVFHIEPLKKPKKKGRSAVVTHKFRVVLFATEGCGIARRCPIGEMLNWFLPFDQNSEQSFCKAYARFDLGLSRTTPTLVFKPSQVHFVNDILASNDREATEFDDPTLKWKKIPSRQVMNDGCSVMSVGAALEIWKLYKKVSGVTGPLPSAFQGRIGGAKGLWMISDESFTKDPEHLAIWIRISASQRKFKPHLEDLSDTTFDRLRLTFEVSNYSTGPAHADLHISFIPILADRDVPRDVIADYMKERLDAAKSELLERVREPVKFYEYVHKNGSRTREGSEMAWQAALPLALEDKIKLFLESGFSPLRLQVLAKNCLRFIKKLHLLQESKLKTPVGKATHLFGVADPLGVLKPGEIHVQFSSSFVDELTDEKYLNLNGHNLLVARQPAVRNSDIQKVRAVICPELSHLVDVVVFPSKGQFPLAGKLQGGDYDGDIFWLCWEDRLVAPFQNAPAPVESPDPEQYGINVNRDQLVDLGVNVHDEPSVDNFLQKSFVFRSAPSLLGIVTKYLEKQSYLENKMSSFRLDRLADMHDLLVDAAKQGYTFTLEDWYFYLRSELRCKVQLKQPIYQDAMDACAAVKDSGADVDKTREKKYEHKAENIIDYLYFEVVRAHNVATMKELQTVLSSATEADKDLLYPREQLDALEDKSIKDELLRIQYEISQLYREWNANTHTDDKGKGIEVFAKVVEDLYARFQAIKPVKTDHPMIKLWLHPWLRPDVCLWDRLRASTLYTKFHDRKTAQTFVFQMAGDELAKIKAESFPRTRYIVANIRANMKPKPIRAFELDDDDDTDDDDEASVLGQRTA
ncbi:RNA dependent RNA polymerase-domain-containing protein [Boeremia exigua]|uniref:RNA dependent RNA polymerase-domain-containing protein n=1 Tax=Boeremia exigua TaxID=749465 RepID=UPI001E8CD0CA|nr:RNA dependent RNA polymerase-domain-containing protein [Boeremia exigua]KAH6644503.1 RNA dependent RNA polymerase-domain-containing protein [Boeremia exigua]